MGITIKDHKNKLSIIFNKEGDNMQYYIMIHKYELMSNIPVIISKLDGGRFKNPLLTHFVWVRGYPEKRTSIRLYESPNTETLEEFIRDICKKEKLEQENTCSPIFKFVEQESINMIQ